MTFQRHAVIGRCPERVLFGRMLNVAIAGFFVQLNDYTMGKKVNFDD